MQVQVNGKICELRENLTVAELVEDLGYAGRRIAVEINLEIVPRSDHPHRYIKIDDKIEIVQAIGGG